MSTHGRAKTTMNELRISLAKLWTYIAERGDVEPLVMPVLGSGYGRLTEKREQIIQEVILSFVAACAEKRFARVA
jgi:hypothetical protein